MHMLTLSPRFYARLASLLWLLGAGMVAPTFARTLTPDDYYRIQHVRDLRTSPDGAWVAYVIGNSDRASDEQRSALWMVSWDGSARVQLTFTEKDVSAPRWSPDGRTLAFLATPEGADKAQLMVLDRRGGGAHPLTTVSGDILSYAWSPDGKRVVLVIEGAVDTPASPTVTAAKAPKPIVITSSRFKHDEAGYLAVGTERHLHVLDVTTRELVALTRDAGAFDDDPVWSPDSAQLAYTHTRERGPDPDGKAALSLIDARAGAVPKTLLRVYAPNHQALAFSPDGTQVAYLEGLEPKYLAYVSDRLMRVALKGGAPMSVAPTLDRAVTSYEVAAAGGGFTALIEDDQATYLSRIGADGTVQRLWNGPGSLIAASTGGGHIAVLASSDRGATEVAAFEQGALRTLTAHNEALLAELDLGAVEDLKFRSRDGTEVHGLLVKPVGYVPGRKYPTVLWIHGGPNMQDEHSLLFDNYPLQFERQLLAAQGYAVLAVNYRGSSGRGAAFQRAIVADWGHKEVEDLLAAVDAVVARGIADPTRLGIGGWSYGGILTDAAIATDTRFRAAISGAGSGNQISMYGSDQYALQYDNELGPAWKNTALWLKVSFPFFHADRIKTPTLFMGGEKDFNVPIAGGEQMYQALRFLGVPTELVVYPTQFHIFTRPSYIVDRAVRYRAWYDRYLKDTN
jgi:dipeptidyl aminopeptidase/acylaminoacyl peptidase